LYWDDIEGQGSGLGSIFGEYVGNAGPTSGIVGWWKLDEPSGLTASDSSGINNGTLTNITGNEWTTGQIDGALAFDGANDYVDLGTSASLKPGTGGYSISLWYNGTGNFITDGVSFGNDWIGFGTSQMGVYSGLTGTTKSYTSPLPNDGAWHNAIFTLDRSTSPDTLTVYLDGVSYDTKTDGNVDGESIASSKPIGIGKNNPLGQNAHFNGSIDDVRIYSKALTQSEVTQLYNAASGGFTQPSNPLPAGTYSCAGSDIAGNSAGNWSVDSSSVDAKTTFYIEDPCVIVTVTKDAGRTTIDSRGYNTCDTSSSRRVERGIRLGPY